MDCEKSRYSDGINLRRFADSGDESSFVAIVDRYAAMVRGVAIRCTGDAAMADEVTQSVFFLLACRAASVPADHLGGWLHRTAFLSARNARRRALRYREAIRELGQQHDAMTDTANQIPLSGSSSWKEIHPYLDEAVARLPERSRTPLMLRFFENRSIREISSLTGKSEAAVRKSLERSLVRLSNMLRRRGVVTSGTALAAILSANCLLAPPASAAALATAALSTANVAASALESASGQAFPGLTASASIIRGAGTALLLAAVPLSLLWRQNQTLKQQMSAAEEGTRNAQTVPRVAPSAENLPVRSLPLVAAAARSGEKTAGPETPESPDLLREKSTREANRELERISLYLPGLTEEQRASLFSFYEKQSLRKAEAFAKARQTGAFTRLAGGISNLTAEDITLFKIAHGVPGRSPDEHEALQDILTDDQFTLHMAATERRRINDAEGVAADVLRTLGQNFDLTGSQKDAIFADVAGFEMNPSAELEGAAAELPSAFRESGRDHVIRQHLTREQAAIFDRRREEDRQRREQFLQTMQPDR